MSINRSIVIERFARKERPRSQMRVFELSSLAGIYADNRCNGDIDAAYRELIKSFDGVGFLGARVLYLHPDVSPPYFRQSPDTDPDPKKPPPTYLPHKLAPIITRQFIKKLENRIGWSETRNGYLAHTWIPARQAARWLQSKGITPPTPIAWSLKAREEKTVAPKHKGRKPGRKPKFDWDDAKDFARQEWDIRGPFKNFETGWKANADLERLVRDYMSKHDEAGEPSDSSLKEHVSKWVLEFEAEN